MNATIHPHPSYDPAYAVMQSRGSDVAWLLKTLAGTLIVRPAHLLRSWWRRYLEREQLLRLDDRVLRDIGITRADALGEWRKSFWQA